jgi:hypothetical protein
VPASEIHSQAHVTQAPTRGCRMVVVQTVDVSDDTQEHDGGACAWRWLFEMHRSDFEKIKTKNFRKRAEGSRFADESRCGCC